MTTLKNNGRRRLGIASNPAIVLDPGQSVEISTAQKEDLRTNRTAKRWLQEGILSLDGEDPVKEHKTDLERSEKESEQLPEGVKGEGVELHHEGGGWWSVYVNGFKVTDTTVRKSEAQEIAKEYE